MKRVVNKMSVSELVGCFEMRENYYQFNKEKLNSISFPIYEKYLDAMFSDKALDFIHVVAVSGYNQNEYLSFAVVKRPEALIAVYNFYNNILPYKGKLHKEWALEAKNDKDTKKMLMNFWNYQLYFQSFFKEEGETFI